MATHDSVQELPLIETIKDPFICAKFPSEVESHIIVLISMEITSD